MSRVSTRFGLTLVVALAATAVSGAGQVRPNAVPIEKLKLPPGFQISVFADRVPDARAMALGSTGSARRATPASGSTSPSSRRSRA